MLKRSFFFYLLLLLSILMFSCGAGYKATKAQRQQEKRIEQRRKEGDRAMRNAQKRHISMQSPETQKRMKQTRNRSKRLLNNKPRDPFYVRWYQAIKNKRN